MTGNRLRFKIRHLLIAATVSAIYFACRNLAVVQLDARFLWLVAPLIVGMLAVSCSAAINARYRSIFAISLLAPLVTLFAWAIEHKLETEASYIVYVPRDSVTLALYVFAIGLPISLACSVVGFAIRFTRDKRISRSTRFTTLAIIASTTACLGFLAQNRWNDPVFRYRVLDDSGAFRTALATAISNGDSITDVTSLLGDGEHRKARSWVEIQMMSADERLDEYPSGIRIDDVFIAYDDGVSQWCLQFRDGLLINLDKEWLVEHYAGR